jgi:hypothetical protein
MLLDPIACLNSLLLYVIGFLLITSKVFIEPNFELKQSNENLAGNLLGRGINGMPITRPSKEGRLYFATVFSAPIVSSAGCAVRQIFFDGGLRREHYY